MAARSQPRASRAIYGRQPNFVRPTLEGVSPNAKAEARDQGLRRVQTEEDQVRREAAMYTLYSLQLRLVVTSVCLGWSSRGYLEPRH